MADISVLLVEDDESIASYIKYRLEKNGYTVNHVDNGVDGIDAIENLKPDLVILDMMMPGLDGREVTELVRENKIIDPARIMILSGKEETDEVKALFELGIHDYLKKPFNIDNLIVRIERALASISSKS
jgi:DNA-binding response OmpR family regulator